MQMPNGRAGTFTYSGDPNLNNKDWVRFRLGDTDRDKGLISDEEINALLTNNSSNKLLTAAELAEHLASRFAREVDSTVNDGSATRTQALGQRVNNYLTLAKTLRTELSFESAPWIGSTSIDSKDTEGADTDRVEPAFRIGMLDNPQQD